MKNIYIVLSFIFFGSFHLMAQQDAQYTQFMFNKLYFNPAYAGSKRTFCMSAVYRQQWLGIDGAPRTQTFNIHAPILKQRVGLGLSVTNDNIGFTNMWNVETSYAYRIPVAEDSYFSIGMRGSVNFVQVRWDQADPTQLLDGSIPGANASKVLPNFGFGLYYDNPRYYVGFSIPHLFNSKMDFTEDNVTGIEPKLERHYFLMGGLIIDLSKAVKFKPAVMFKYVPRSPFDMDLNVSFLFLDKLWAGVTYRLGDSVDGVLQYAFTPNFKLGLGYDYTLTKLQRYNSGSIEVMLEYCFMSKNVMVHNPRYF